MDVRTALAHVVDGAILSRAEMRAVVESLLSREIEPTQAVQLGALLGALAARGEAPSEIAGAADALRERMIVFEHDHIDAIDTCGTGGDGLASFNLSTAAAIVAAACGAKVVKHGNRSQSSRCGSADLIEAAGIPLDLAPAAARVVLDEVGITFLFAPAYHPVLKSVAAVRKAIGARTLFNFLGPLCNPGRVKRQLLGVPRRERVEPMARALHELGHVRAYVVHGAGGADELTLEGSNHVEPVGDAPRVEFDARALGFGRAPATALCGGDARENLRLLHAVLAGERTPLRDAVALNASAALVVAGIARDATDGAQRALEALDQGLARATLARWVDGARLARTT